MAALSNVVNTLFGSIGAQDPEILKPAVAFKRAVDFGLSNLDASKNYAFLPIPAGFVMTGVYFGETVKCTGGTLTLKTVNDPTKTVGAAFAVGASALKTAFVKPVAAVVAKDTAGTGTVNVPGGELTFDAADMLCIVPSAKMTDGAIEVVIHGYMMNGGSPSAAELSVPYREGQSAADYAGNKSGGDLYLQKVAAKA